MQLRPDHIQKENAAPSPVKNRISSLGQPTTAQTCISGCTLLANPSRGIPMREVRPGTPLLNAKGKMVLVTNVYFSRESAVMVQISEHCHTTITHPLVDTQKQKQGVRGRRKPTKTIVAAAEWHTRRRNHFYQSTPRGTLPPHPLEHQVEYHLHYSSPQNLRKSGDLWGFSTQDNQPVRSYDDPSCLICPIGHIGWAQVDIATAILSCWGRAWHLPDPRPDLAEFQEQTEAIHVFLSSPEAVEKLEVKRRRMDPGASSARHKRPIEFTNGHLQLKCLRGGWLVQNWRDEETPQYSWIAPEENLLSALIRPPCNEYLLRTNPPPLQHAPIGWISQQNTTLTMRSTPSKKSPRIRPLRDGNGHTKLQKPLSSIFER